ncbi:MAG TPA: sigma-70 family RNA polymerase sigma factor [Myxococcales bacterium]|nr:sigma-70 family RNA polymerase sigma factor [Myxococcales bacterium]HIN85649.1 sigma-70 family RNA polymerase sigma factor [Myxococcales bacterium]
MTWKSVDDAPSTQHGELDLVLMDLTLESEQIALLERARAGDTQALETLLKAVQPQIYRFSMKMCRHTEDAEDVLQDSMMTLARTFRDFRGASALSTWLFSVARSFCIKKRRKSKFAPRVEESLDKLDSVTTNTLTSKAPTPHDQAENKEVWEQLQEAISSLEPAYREVLVLRDVEGLKAKEVAEIVGISTAAVKSRLHRSRKQLRELLSDRPYKQPIGCPDIRAVFYQHLEGELSTDMCATMEAHVKICSHCANECDGLKETLNICRTAPSAEPSESCQVRVDASIRKALGIHSA